MVVIAQINKDHKFIKFQKDLCLLIEYAVGSIDGNKLLNTIS